MRDFVCGCSASLYEHAGALTDGSTGWHCVGACGSKTSEAGHFTSHGCLHWMHSVCAFGWRDGPSWHQVQRTIGSRSDFHWDALVSVRVLRGWMPQGGDIQVGLEHFDPLRSLSGSKPRWGEKQNYTITNKKQRNKYTCRRPSFRSRQPRRLSSLRTDFPDFRTSLFSCGWRTFVYPAASFAFRGESRVLRRPWRSATAVPM